MCEDVHLAFVLLAAAFVLAALWAFLAQRAFLRELGHSRPDVWKLLGSRKVWTEDGDKNLAAAQRFVIWGEYRLLDDPALVALGHRARLACASVAGVLLLAAIAIAMSQGAPAWQACLR